MYFAVGKLDADRFANLDFVMNFGIGGEYKVLFTSFIDNGGSYEQAKENVFAPTPVLMLLKLHTYFNWADKKLHTAFFIENKDNLNEDLLADFKEEGKGLEVKPGLGSKNAKVVEDKKPKGLVQQEQNIFNTKGIMRVGLQKPNIIDVNSKQDFPTLSFSVPSPLPAATTPVPIPEAAAS
jgi:hypothetical protein